MPKAPSTAQDTALPATPPAEERQWSEQWQHLTETHFDRARQRVEPVYQQHFASLGTVCRRHWQHRADVPKDLLNLPRGLWRLASYPLRRKSSVSNHRPTGKELALVMVINHELLDIDALRRQFHSHIQLHPAFTEQHYQNLEDYFRNMSPQEAQQKLHIAVERLRLSHEGTRDLLLFVSLGLASRSLADKVAFGGAAAIGSSLATSIYLGQKTFWGTLWAGWFGTPGWVAAAGAASGIGAILIATPIISPFTETGINRLRAKKTLHRIIDETQARTQHAQFDAGSTAGQVATYLQLLPDLVQLLKQIR